MTPAPVPAVEVRSGVLVAWLRSTRLAKVIPLVLVLFDAAVLPGGSVDGVGCALAATFILVISVFATQLNILTDVDLDRARKPQLFAWLTRSGALMRGSFVAQVMIGLALLVAAGSRSPALGASLLVYGCAIVLYSYNFFSWRRPRARRLKVFWWGNALAVIGGYTALWAAGLACAGLTLGRGAIGPLAIAGGAPFVDYGVFLNECSGDAEEERRHGLRTLPALLGARRASLVGLAVLGVGAVAVIGGAQALLARARVRAAIAVLLYLGLQGLGCAGSLLVARRRDRRRAWEVIIDSSFWLSRTAMLAILLVP
jgi:4-hydroxybenzoate polyprenyltransferase